MRASLLRTVRIASAVLALGWGVREVAGAQSTPSAATAAPTAVATADPGATPAVLERPDLRTLWRAGMALVYHRTAPGDRIGDVSRYVLEGFTKDNCAVSPCSKWRVYFPKKDPKQRDEEREGYEYFDGDGNLYDVTTLRGRSVGSCYARVLRFPLRVPSDAQDGCSAVALQGGANHVAFQMHYEWQRVPSTYGGSQGVWTVHVTIKQTCTLCTIPTISHAYYYPPRAVWLLRVEGDDLYDLASITP